MPTIARGLSLSALIGFGALVLLAGLQAEQQIPGAALLAPVVFAAAVVVAAACLGKPWALKVYLFFLVVGVDLAFRSRDASDMSVDGSVLYRLMLWSGALLAGLANLPASWRYLRNASCLGLLAYLVLAALSAGWSLTPRYSLGCAYGFLCIFPFVAAVVARVGLPGTLQVALLAMGAHVLLALLGWIAVPDLVMWQNWSGSETRLRGFLGHPFRMAEGAAVFLLTGWILWRQRWLATPVFALVASIGGLALLLTQTRSSIAGVVLALFAAGRFRRLGLAGVAAAAMVTLIAVNAIPGALEVFSRQISRGANVDNALTLTGRTYIWEESFRLFADRPVLGYGYAATRALFLERFVTENPQGESPPHAHNTLVQSLVTTGIVGTLLLLIPLAIPLIHSLRHRDGLANPLTWYVIIVGFAGLGPIGSTPRSLTVFWILSLLMVHWSERAASESTPSMRPPNHPAVRPAVGY